MFRKAINIAVMAILSTACAVYAQDAAEDAEQEEVQVSPWEVNILQNGARINIAEYTIENLTLSSNSARAAATPAKLSRTFMFATTDAKAKPAAWQALANENQIDSKLAPAATISNEFKKSTLPAVLLNGGESVIFPKSLLTPDEIYAARGGTLRFFVWIKAEDTGAGTDLSSGAPFMNITVINGGNVIIANERSLFKTRGTFPWHCYFMDVKIPINFYKSDPIQENAEEKKADEGKKEEKDKEKGEENEAGNEDAEEEEEEEEKEDDSAAIQTFLSTVNKWNFIGEEGLSTILPCGVYVTITNPASGKAWFSTISWQRIRNDNSIFTTNAKAIITDTVTGSNAPNPDYDELPMHFFFGYSSKVKWNYLKGTKSIKDITSAASLKTYIANYKNDWFHALHAFPYLATLCTNGRLLETMNEFEEGWEDALAEELYALQDKQTGLWGVNGKPNLFITKEIINNSFSPVAPQHEFKEPRQTPWRSIKDKPLRLANEIISSIVANQKVFRGAPAGWNNFTFQDDVVNTDLLNSVCDLPATAAAAQILRAALPYAAESEQKKAKDALASAWTYVTSNLIFKNGLWKKSQLDSFSTTPGNMFLFLDATQWLEANISPDLLPVNATAEFNADTQKVTVTWTKESPYVSLRVYAVPEDIAAESPSEKYLIAILQPQINPPTIIEEQDPLLSVQKLIEKSYKNWGITPAAEGAEYITYKLSLLQKKLKVFPKTRDISIKIEQAKVPQKIVIAGVTTYGALSPLTTLEDTIPALEQQEE